MAPTRILQVVTIMNRGGLETMLMNYYRKIDHRKIQFDFMVHREDEGHYDKEIISLGGRIFRMPPIRPGNYRLYFNLLDEFFSKHREYRVVHSHINENSSFVLRAAKKMGVPARIAHSHLSDLGIDAKLPFRVYARFFLKGNTTNYFACSTKAGKWLFGRKKINSKNVTILNNAVDVNEFEVDSIKRDIIRKELDIEDKFVIGHVGRFNEQKNHEFLIDIFKAVNQENSKTVLLLIGEGDLRRRMEKKVAALGLSSNVRFLGIRTDIPTLMQGMDLFVFPSLFEGLPVVLVEAQAAGLNCIVSNTITEECDVTGRVKFLDIKDSPLSWSKTILTSKYDHVDTRKQLINCGYDTSTMAQWLTNYYLKAAK